MAKETSAGHRKRATDDAGHDGGDDHGAEIANAERAQDDFQREDDAGDGCVESRRDAARRATSHKVADPVVAQAQDLPQGRTQ